MTFATAASLAIFVATYVLISVQKIRFLNLDRASAALGGAVLMVACGCLSLKQAYEGINLDTIALLLGMMVIVASLKLAGFFEWVSTWILLKARTPRRLLWMLVFASGGLSALFVNDTICVLFTPILLEAVLRARLVPAPYLIALVTSSNIGSVMTLTGNPQNMLVGIFSGIGYGKFFLALAPVAMAGLVICALMIEWIYRGRLGESFPTEGLELPRVDRAALGRIGGVLAVVLAGFLLPLGSWLPAGALAPGQNLPLAAAAGAVLVILLGRHPPARAFGHVDWPLLLFFASLFVVIQGVGQTGILTEAHAQVKPAFGTTAAGQAAALTAFSVAMSNVVSNVPFVLVAKSWMSGCAAPELMWLVLAMSSTFAGNLTIVGSVANMIVMELSKDRARVGVFEYLKVGAPLTLVTTAVGLGMLLAMHGAGLIR
jgi:Na+/H+ antiporter NhaD/arsenite permease-like protein